MKTVIWVVLAAVLFGAVGFWGGVTYQRAQGASGFAGRFGGGAGGFPGGGPGAGGGFGGGSSSSGGFRNSANIATGTVIAVDAQSITVKNAEGGSKTIFVSGQTAVSKQDVLKVTDVKVGDQVAAFGQAANGGIDARMVQVVPPGGSFRFGGMGGGGRGFGGGGAGAPQGAPAQ